MDPVLATGLVNLGQRVLSNVLDLSPSQQQTTAQFSKLLNDRIGQEGSPLAAWLGQEGVRNPADLQALGQKLKTQLVQHPELASELGTLSPDKPLYLQRDAQGRYTVSDGEGKNILLAPDSEAAKLAARLDEVQQLLTQQQAQPTTTMAALIDQLPATTGVEATWSLRG